MTLLHLIKTFWEHTKKDYHTNTTVKILLLSGMTLIGLLLVNTLLHFITTALEIPITSLLVLFSIFIIVALIKKKNKGIQDYLIAFGVIALAVIYPFVLFNTDNSFRFNTVLAIITIFLALAIILLWNIAKKTNKTDKRKITFVSIFMLIFFIITLFSWIYTLLILFHSEGGLRYGNCNENNIIPSKEKATQHTFYFSAITFTTVGYGDICPQGQSFRTIAALEALIGMLSLPTVFYILSKPEQE